MRWIEKAIPTWAHLWLGSKVPSAMRRFGQAHQHPSSPNALLRVRCNLRLWKVEDPHHRAAVGRRHPRQQFHIARRDARDGGGLHGTTKVTKRGHVGRKGGENAGVAGGLWWGTTEKIWQVENIRELWISIVLSVSFCLVKFGEFAAAERIVYHCWGHEAPAISGLVSPANKAAFRGFYSLQGSPWIS